LDYLHHRSLEACRQLPCLAREGEIGINALYAYIERSAASPEEMAGAFCLAAWYHREDVVPMGASAQGDMPTYSGALPTFLTAAGIKFLVGGPNQRSSTIPECSHWREMPLNLESHSSGKEQMGVVVILPGWQ
jgi:hypothetical protein